MKLKTNETGIWRKTAYRLAKETLEYESDAQSYYDFVYVVRESFGDIKIPFRNINEKVASGE
jgi:hypothetical protein